MVVGLWPGGMEGFEFAECAGDIPVYLLFKKRTDMNRRTTTELTTTFATWVAKTIGLGSVEGGIEVVVRAVRPLPQSLILPNYTTHPINPNPSQIFFGLNLIFNGIMWTLFTKALARGTSTTQVSILNTSANFTITAVMGWLIFSESLPPLWFVGAALLVVGNVIIGRREEGEEKDAVVGGQGGLERRSGDGHEEGEGLLGEEVELESESEADERKRRREEEDVLQLDLDDNAGREGRLI